ncbi:hypothetical protein M0805_009566 [Coniferiporia weirii]|nr:hypothetical protein M0805_009566 [Coniferiporia weirii]
MFDSLVQALAASLLTYVLWRTGGVARVKGSFGSDYLYVWDPLALHNILVKDQYIFEESKVFIETNKIAFGKSLLSTLGEEHKRQRKMLNPVFSPKHMRDMLPMLYPIAHQLRDGIVHDIHRSKGDVDVMAWVSRAALEYIGQGGLGYSFSALDMKKKTNSYSEALKMFFPLLFNLIFVQRWLCLAQVGGGKDIMSILLRANVEIDLPESELIGHMSTFVLAGHDTTTSAVSRILHLLALHQDVQSKLREEVTAARKEHGDLDYDTLQALPYLDAVCRETMRVYSPIPIVERVATKDAVVPLEWPIKSTDGKTEITEIMVPKNTGIVISILSANLSTKIWGDDAEEWKPERWLKPLAESVAEAHLPGIYSQMMSFIGGGRACIGFKFSEMEMKMVLSILLEVFIFEPGHDVFWEFSFIHAPIAKGTKDGMPRLPLKVSFVKN